MTTVTNNNLGHDILLNRVLCLFVTYDSKSPSDPGISVVESHFMRLSCRCLPFSHRVEINRDFCSRIFELGKPRGRKDGKSLFDGRRKC